MAGLQALPAEGAAESSPAALCRLFVPCSSSCLRETLGPFSGFPAFLPVFICCHIILRAEDGKTESELENNVFAIKMLQLIFCKYFLTCSMCQAPIHIRILQDMCHFNSCFTVVNQGTYTARSRSYTARNRKPRSLSYQRLLSLGHQAGVLLIPLQSHTNCGKAFRLAHSKVEQSRVTNVST